MNIKILRNKNNIKLIKTTFESKLNEENLSEIEKENIKSSLELIKNLIKY
jgi:hypothetical protein